MFGAVNPGFRSLALKLVMNVVGELYTEKNSCGIARFPCDSTAFLLSYGIVFARYCYSKPSIHPSVRDVGVPCTRVISLGLRSSEPQHRQSSPRRTPQIKLGWNRNGVQFLAEENLQYLWNGARYDQGCYW